MRKKSKFPRFTGSIQAPISLAGIELFAFAVSEAEQRRLKATVDQDLHMARINKLPELALQLGITPAFDPNSRSPQQRTKFLEMLCVVLATMAGIRGFQFKPRRRFSMDVVLLVTHLCNETKRKCPEKTDFSICTDFVKKAYPDLKHSSKTKAIARQLCNRVSAARAASNRAVAAKTRALDEATRKISVH